MRKMVLVVMIAVGVAAIFLAFGKRPGHGRELTAYFTDVRGLRTGAPIQLAGVEVGRVVRVHARPDLRDNPAEVLMALRTEYELSIPKDSVASVGTAGVLGETYVILDVHEATGPPVGDRGVLKSRASSDPTPEQLFEHLSQILNRKSCGTPAQEKDPEAENPTSHKPLGKP
jgi:phospholipid/cholesterol/gamma-HCH transport system substrate-binding protein